MASAYQSTPRNQGFPPPFSLSESDVEYYVKNRLEGFHRAGGEWRGPCPIHQGKNASFAIETVSGRWFCHSKCNEGGTLVELEARLSSTTTRSALANLRSLLNKNIQRPARNGTSTPKPRKQEPPFRVADTYEYTDADGEVLFRTVREERTLADGRREKRFRAERWDSTKRRFVSGMGEVSPALFNLPNVMTADRVFVVEGEKCAKVLQAMGLVATTCPFGAGKWNRSEYSESLAGKEVVILPDNDKPGRDHAQQVQKAVSEKARSVLTVELPVSEKGDVADWIGAGGTASQLEELIRQARPSTPPPAEAADEGPEEAPDLPRGFKIRDGRLYRTITPGDGREEFDMLLSGALHVIAETRDHRGQNWGKLVQFADPDGRQKQLTITQADLNSVSGTWISALAKDGLEISPKARVKEHLREYLFESRSRNRRTLVSRPGWTNGQYITPAWQLPERQGEQIILDTMPETQRFGMEGSLEDWQTNVAALCLRNELLKFAVSVGFAPILLPWCPDVGGGFHFASNSTTGKSTLLVVAGSVFGGGDPRHGFGHTWDVSIGGVEFLAESHNHALLTLDEMGQFGGDPATLKQVPYMLAHGMGKTTLTRDRRGRRGASWDLIYLSSGEIGFLESLEGASVKVRDGQEVRLCEIPMQRAFGAFDHPIGSDAAAFAERIKTAALRHYGTAAHAFVGRFLEVGADDVARLLRREMDGFLDCARQRFGTVGETAARAMKRFAFVSAAGEIATHWGITGWPESEARKGALAACDDWLRHRKTSGSIEHKRILDRVRQRLVQFRGRLQLHSGGVPQDRDQKFPSTQLGFTEERERGVEYQFVSGLPRELCEPDSSDKVLKVLDAAKVLLTDKNRMDIKRALPGFDATKRQRCHVILRDRLFAEDEENGRG